MLCLYICSGYAKRHTVSGLDPQSEYKYRMRMMNNAGSSDWSAHVKVTTTSMYMYIVLIKSRCESESVLSASILVAPQNLSLVLVLFLGNLSLLKNDVAGHSDSTCLTILTSGLECRQSVHFNNCNEMFVLFIFTIHCEQVKLGLLSFISKIKIVDHYLTSLWVCMNCKFKLNIQNYRNLICVSFKLLSFI